MRKESLKLARNRGTKVITEHDAPPVHVEMAQEAPVANGGQHNVPKLPLFPKPVEDGVEQQTNGADGNRNGGIDIASRPSMTAVLNELRSNDRHVSGAPAAEYYI